MSEQVKNPRTTSEIVISILKIFKGKYLTDKANLHPNDFSRIKRGSLKPKVNKMIAIRDALRETEKEVIKLRIEFEEKTELRKKSL